MHRTGIEPWSDPNGGSSDNAQFDHRKHWMSDIERANRCSLNSLAEKRIYSVI